MAQWRLAALTSVMMSVALTAQLTATTRSAVPPPPPAGAPASVGAAGHNARVSLTWSAVDGAFGYRIFRRSGTGENTLVASVSRTFHTNTGLVNGTMYSYTVAAFNRGGMGPVSSEVSAMPLAPPTGVTATAGDTQIALSWQASAGASAYDVYRKTSTTNTFAIVAEAVTGLTLVDTGLTNGTRYYYRVRARANGGMSALSVAASAKPQPPPPTTAPTHLTATPGITRVQLSWDPVSGATSYRVYRAIMGSGDPLPVAIVTAPAFKNTGLVNGTTYVYRVAARNAGGEGPATDPVSATPLAPPPAPTDVSATAGDRQVTISWTLVPGAAGYNVYRGTAPNGEAAAAVAAGIAGPSFVNTGLENGPTYYFKVTALNAGGQSPRSLEVSASPEGPPPTGDADTLAAFRLLRQATWGPKPGEVEALKTMGADAFIAGQLAATPSTYPDELFAQSVEATQERFMQLALTGPDQLRQRVAWALHKIWVVSAVDVDNASAIVTYQRILLNGAFGNYRDLMRDITLNPAMGRYLNMLNNRSQLITGALPNENYARELMQLFTEGIPTLNPNGTPILNGGVQVPVYTEADVKELARIFTGWTFGDGDPATIPRRLASENFRVPMEAVVANHDIGAKTFLGESFPANQTARQDLDQALDILFRHANVGPFISRQLIQQLVTSNPSPAYVGAVAAVFGDNGAGIRGDLGAVVRAILTHPEAGVSTTTSGKLSEPVLFIVSQLRALNASVTDHPFMSDKSEEMGQKVFYPPSVFSYFSPGYRVRGTNAPGGAPLGGPEFQILTTVTTLVRANFVGYLLAGSFGGNVTIDYGPFTSRADDAPALVDYCNVLLMGGGMSTEERTEIIAAVRATPAGETIERSRTALYLTLVAAQGQVDR